MSALQYAKDKLTSTIALLVELQSNDFPYEGPLDALAKLEEQLQDQLDIVSKTIDPGTTDPFLINFGIRRATSDVLTALKFAGFIVNSANVRNIFEVHSSLLQIARRFIDNPEIVDRDPAQLILSFEWNYIPFTYPMSFPELPSFVVIGLPASESFNSLIIPAAGHELGHTVWKVTQPNRRYSYNDKYKEILINRIPELIIKDFWKEYEKLDTGFNKTALRKKTRDTKTTWALSHYCALRQIEEVFCDLFGLGLFGEAYLHAFKYLIAPSIFDHRSGTYPTSRRRAKYLAQASKSKAFNVKVPSGFVNQFVDEILSLGSNEHRLWVEIADRCTEVMFDSILKDVTSFFENKNHHVPKQKDWKDIVSDFKKFVPTSKAKGLAEIINAGWHVYHAPHYLPDSLKNDETSRQNLEDRRLLKINELVLKSIEVHEIEDRLDKYKQAKRA